MTGWESEKKGRDGDVWEGEGHDAKGTWRGWGRLEERGRQEGEVTQRRERGGSEDK